MGEELKAFPFAMAGIRCVGLGHSEQDARSHIILTVDGDEAALWGWDDDDIIDIAARALNRTPDPELVALLEGQVQHFTTDKLDAWVERSKNDRAVFVGSDIRMLAGDFKRILTTLARMKEEG